MLYKDALVGITIHGFCNGYFGRDSYGDKVIIASGQNWLVAEEGDEPVFAVFDDSEDMEALVKKWAGNDPF